MKGDYHIHSIYSSGDILKFDSCYRPKEIVKYAKKIGFDWIGFTEHNCIISKPWKNAGKKFGITIIPGIELTFKTGKKFWFWEEQYHVIGLGIEEFYKVNSLGEFCDMVKERDGLTIAPHCFSIAGMKEKAKEVDAIEIFNPLLGPLSNLRAKIFCKKENKIALAGSDSHSLRSLGKVLLDVDCKNDEDSIVQSLKKGKFNILKREYLTPLEIYEILREKYTKNYKYAINYLEKRKNWERNLGKKLLDWGVKSENKAKTIYSLSYIGMEFEDSIYHLFGLFKTLI